MTSEKKPDGKVLAAWTLGATVLGLASDLAQPVGPFAAILAGLFGTGAAGAFGLSYVVSAAKGLLRSTAAFSGVGCAVMSAVVGLQMTTQKEDDRGFLASAVPVVAHFQQTIINVEVPNAPEKAEPPADTEQQDLSPPPPPPADPLTDTPEAKLAAGLASADSSVRLQAALEALNSPDGPFLSAAIEKLYTGGDAALRQAAIMRIIERRGNSTLPINVVDDPANDTELAMKFQGYALNVSGINRGANAFNVYSMAGYTTAVVGRSELSLKLTPFDNTPGTLTLVAQDDFTMSGAFRTDTGKVVKLKVALL